MDGSYLMTYVDSLCDAMVRSAGNPVARGETYWIADETPYTTLEIYSTLADILGVELGVSRYPAFASSGAAFVDGVLQALGLYQMEIHVAGEMHKDIACSVAKARKDLGWEPSADLRTGAWLRLVRRAPGRDRLHGGHDPSDVAETGHPAAPSHAVVGRRLSLGMLYSENGQTARATRESRPCMIPEHVRIRHGSSTSPSADVGGRGVRSGADSR